jgi:hypothetical protein
MSLTIRLAYPVPTEVEAVNVEGFEMIATNVRVIDNPNTPGGGKVCRFTGTCTSNSVNDPIRHTSFNGGTYGWKVASTH